jgi:hypothetical protein
MGARWTTAQVSVATGDISEHELQAQCVIWFRNHYRHLAPYLFAVPNGADLGGKDRIARAKRWQKLEREGARPGVADLLLMVPSGDLHGLWIEMKTPRGTQSKEQMQFEMNAVAMGYGYAMPRTKQEFRRVVSEYLDAGRY